MFPNVYRSSWSTDCAAENSRPRVVFWNQRGDQPSKIPVEKFSISRATVLGFLRFLVSAIWCEANKSNRRRKERPMLPRRQNVDGSAATPARLAQDVVAANMRAEVRARMRNWSIWIIWCQGSSRSKGCVMAYSKTRPARGEPTEQNLTCGGEILNRSVDSARFLACTR